MSLSDTKMIEPLEAKQERGDPHPQLSQSMEGLTYSDFPPGFEHLQLIKASSSSPDHTPPPPPPEGRVGTEESANKRPKKAKDDANTNDPLFKLSQALRSLFRECNSNLKSVCNLKPPGHPIPYNNTVDHVTAILLRRTTMGSNVHVKRVCLTEKAFDPRSLPTTSRTAHIEWITKDKEYIFQLARKPPPILRLDQPSHPTVGSSSSVRIKEEFTPEIKKACIPNNVLITPTPMLYANSNEGQRWAQQKVHEYTTALKGKGTSTANIVVDATPISYVKANEQIVRPVKNEKEYINALKGKGTSTANIVVDATPISYVKANEQIVRPVKSEKEYITALKCKGTSTSNIVVDATPISYVKANEQIVRPVENEKDYINALKGTCTANIVVDATPISYVKANEQIVRPVKNEKEFITELKGASTTRIVLDATPISCVKSNERIIQSVQTEKQFIAKLRGESSTKKILNPTPISYVKPNERVVRLQNEKDFITDLKCASTANILLHATPNLYMKADEQILRSAQNEKDVTGLKHVSTSNEVSNATPLSYVKPREQTVQPVQYKGKEAVATGSESSIVLDVEPISYMTPDEQIVKPMGNELVVVSENNELGGNKTIKVPTERIGWLEADFKVPFDVVGDITEMNLNKLIMPEDVSAGANIHNREFCFAERLSNWFVEVRSRESGKYDIYYYHRTAPRMFRSTKEVMKFIMYEAYPGRPSKNKGSGNLENSSGKRRGASSNGGVLKRRRRNQLVIRENEAILAKSFDEAFTKWMSSSSGAGGDKGDEATTKLLVDQAMKSPGKMHYGKATSMFPVNTINIEVNNKMCDEKLQQVGNKKDGEATDKFLVDQALSIIPCNPCLAVQGNNGGADKVIDIIDLTLDD